MNRFWALRHTVIGKLGASKVRCSKLHALLLFVELKSACPGSGGPFPVWLAPALWVTAGHKRPSSYAKLQAVATFGSAFQSL